MTLSVFQKGLLSAGIFGALLYKLKKSKRQYADNSSVKQAGMSALKKYPEIKSAVSFQQGLAESYPITALFPAATLVINTKIVVSCHDLVPQGLAVSRDYLFISAYCYKHEHHSVVLMIDRASRLPLKTLLLKGRPHVGGLAYDEAHGKLWVSISKGKAAAIDLADIEQYQLERDKRPIRYSEEADLDNLERASFLTKFGEYLIAGCFEKYTCGKIVLYPFAADGHLLQFKETANEKSGELSFTGGQLTETTAELKEKAQSKAVSVGTIPIAKQVQGIAFYKNYLLLSQSYGRVSSRLLIFDLNHLQQSVLTEKEAIHRYYLPPYLEQIVVEEDKLYTLFESGAKGYRGKVAHPVESVLVFDLPILLLGER